VKNRLDKLLTSDKVIYSLPWIYAISSLLCEVYGIIYNLGMTVFDLGLEIINILLVFGIAISYKAHEKNIMKTLFGAVLMGQIIAIFNYVSFCFENGETVFVTVINIILLLLMSVFFVNHLVLGYGHKASPDRVKLNRVIGVLTAVVAIIQIIPAFSSTEIAVYCIMGLIAEHTIIIEILCIETKVDAYKIIRENK